MPTEDTSTDPEGQEPEGDEQDTDEAEIEGLDDSARSKIQKVNKEAQALRKRAKAAEDRLAEIDAANKTDAEKAADRLADAEKKATEAPGTGRPARSCRRQGPHPIPGEAPTGLDGRRAGSGRRRAARRFQARRRRPGHAPPQAPRTLVGQRPG
ncbi:MAG: hypothetical protein IPH38_18090 [Candidatus Microthrix sp.]|nr:hypothetical protein [Candidatus Microthrix sp.]MBK7021443.1 hypothetical protein [Candidatus Microthrix sp.]